MGRPVAQRGEGRARVLAAAEELFGARGVAETSLQDIAASLGVTKAAVYFQFKSKSELVLAVLEPVLRDYEAVVAAAELVVDEGERRRVAVEGMLDVGLKHAQLSAVLHQDRTVGEVVASSPRVRRLTHDLELLLLGTAPTVSQRVAVSLLSQGFRTIRSSVELDDIDDHALRRELLRLAQAVLPAQA